MQCDRGDRGRDHEPLDHGREIGFGRELAIPEELLQAFPRHEEVSGECVGPDLLVAPGGPVPRVAVEPVSEQHVPEFVRECAALPHRIGRRGHADEHGAALGVAHRQPVLVRLRIQNRNVVPGDLLDDGDEIAQGLDSQVVFPAEAQGGGAAVLLGTQRSSVSPPMVAGMA